MTSVRIHSFALTTIGGSGGQIDPEPWTAFEWNDSGDDTGLVTWAEEFRPGQLSVSIDVGEFNWEQTANGSATGSFTLIAGIIVRLWKTPGLLGEPVHVEHYEGVPAGRWFSDQYGRPFDVNDLEAP